MTQPSAQRETRNEKRETVVVLGAGVAGLAAAIRLKELGVPRVVVLERAEQAGGLARTLQVGPGYSDIGPHRLYTDIPEIERFYREVAAGSLFDVERHSRIFLEGRFLRYPPGIRDLLRVPGPLRLAGFAASWAKAQALALAGRRDDRTCDGLMRRAYGSALYEYMLRPYSEKVFKTDPRRLDAEAARVRIPASSLASMVRWVFPRRNRGGAPVSLARFHYLRGGAQGLVDHMLRRARGLGAEILTRNEAIGFVVESGRVAAAATRSPEGERLVPADAFISTIPLPDLAEALHRAQPMKEAALESARALRYLDLLLVLLLVKRNLVSGNHWIYFPEPRFIFNRACEPKAFDPGLAPRDRSVLSCDITCRPGQDLWNEPDEAIYLRVVAELAGTGLFRVEEVADVAVYRVRHAYPVYDLGYGKNVDEALAGLSQYENLVTTGRQGLFNYNNMDHSIFMGFRAAVCAAQSPRPALRWLSEQEAFRGFRIVD
ncbi:MAG: FAD-dependent oxidoreductase [Candidatus Sumerlaeota bacterium]|nr:FAD-dependent oxidoreductase [Candidatus Sumerlaeota bacterium]